MKLVDIDRFLIEESPKICRDYDGVGCPEDGYTSSQLKNAPTVTAIVIPNDATNGDMIMALFSNVKWWVNEDNEVFTDHKTTNSNRIAINADWWKAPYRKESK